MTLRNALDNNEPASFHLHGSALYVAATGAPALAANPDATASPGAAVTYEWWVSDNEPEGTTTSIATARADPHGLFGAVIVEPGLPPGPSHGSPCRAVGRPSFRTRAARLPGVRH